MAAIVILGKAHHDKILEVYLWTVPFRVSQFAAVKSACAWPQNLEKDNKLCGFDCL